MNTPYPKTLAARLESLPLPAAERARILREAEYAERVADDLIATWRDLQRVAASVRSWFSRRLPAAAAR